MILLHLLTLVYVTLIALGCGVCTYWTLELMGRPDDDEVNLRQIFSFYGLLIQKWYDRIENPIKAKIRSADCQENLSTRQQFKIALTLNHAKAFGACGLCYGTWLTAIVSGAIFYFTDVSLWWILYCLPISNISFSYINQRF